MPAPGDPQDGWGNRGSPARALPRPAGGHDDPSSAMAVAGEGVRVFGTHSEAAPHGRGAHTEATGSNGRGGLAMKRLTFGILLVPLFGVVPQAWAGPEEEVAAIS